MSQLVLRGITAHQFAGNKDRDEFLAAVKLDEEGLPAVGTDYAKLAGCIGGTLADTKLTQMVVAALINGARQRDEVNAIEAAADEVNIYPNRNGDGYSVFQGPSGKRKHLVYVATGTVRRIHAMHDELAAIATTGMTGSKACYYSAVPSYEIQRGKRKGEMQAAKPAVIVQVQPGGLATKITHKGPAAEDYAAENKLVAINNPAQDEDAEEENGNGK